MAFLSMPQFSVCWIVWEEFGSQLARDVMRLWLLLLLSLLELAICLEKEMLDALLLTLSA
jgi:hypothetical protein